jgi:hypothetical protein
MLVGGVSSVTGSWLQPTMPVIKASNNKLAGVLLNSVVNLIPHLHSII